MKIVEPEDDQTIVVPAKGGRKIVASNKTSLIKSNYQYEDQGKLNSRSRPA